MWQNNFLVANQESGHVSDWIHLNNPTGKILAMHVLQQTTSVTLMGKWHSEDTFQSFMVLLGFTLLDCLFCLFSETKNTYTHKSILLLFQIRVNPKNLLKQSFLKLLYHQTLTTTDNIVTLEKLHPQFYLSLRGINFPPNEHLKLKYPRIKGNIWLFEFHIDTWVIYCTDSWTKKYTYCWHKSTCLNF